jgi:NitT/TauT family transport system ATP-binding protein
MTTRDAAVRIKNVSHQFGEAGETQFVRALADTSLDIARGELLCLIGPSGCGKSTLLNVMGGLMTPSSGSVEVAGKPVRGPMPHDIAFVFQENALFPWNTVIENVRLAMLFQGVAKSEHDTRAKKCLDAVGLSDFADHYPSQLSGGMQKRCAIARTMVYEPEMLLMDEPFGALDAITKTTLQKTILDIWQRRQTSVIFITHDLTEAIALSDRVAVMTGRPGRVRATFDVPLQRPRDVYNIVDLPEFKALRRELWQLLETDLEP